MDTNQQLIKAKIEHGKIELDKKKIDYVSQSIDAKVSIQLSQQISMIIYKGEEIENELITVINLAIAEAKIEFEKGMFKIFNDLGIKM